VDGFLDIAADYPRGVYRRRGKIKMIALCSLRMKMLFLAVMVFVGLSFVFVSAGFAFPPKPASPYPFDGPLYPLDPKPVPQPCLTPDPCDEQQPVVPEPLSMALFGMGMAGLAVLKRKKGKRS